MFHQIWPTRAQTSAVGSRSARASGLTLIEILAAVFVLSMGLILVAAAFPVGLSQTQLMQTETDMSSFAAELVEMVKIYESPRKMSASQYNTFSEGRSRAIGHVSDSQLPAAKWWMINNVNRWAYELSEDYAHDSAMAPVRHGDLVCIPFLTRLSKDNEVALYRLTMPMRKHSPENTGILSNVKITGASNEKLAGDFGTAKKPKIFPGDYILDQKTGFCYPVASVNDDSKGIVLAQKPEAAIAANSNVYILGPMEGVFYSLISH